MRFLCLVFFASGCSALIYEVLWLRQLAHVFGVTVYATSTVLSSFMGGLAAGSFVAGRVADRLKNPLRLFGLIEIGIGIFALAMPALLRELQALYGMVHAMSEGSFELVSLARFGLCFAALLVPTTLMGATLPVILRSALVGSHDPVGKHVSLLYAANTAGAIIGCCATGFFLIGTLGIRATSHVAVALNLVVGTAACIVAARSRPLESGPAALRGNGAARECYPAQARSAALWAFGLSGFCSLAYQVIWMRSLAPFFNATVYSFTLILAIFLAGLAAGSFAMRRFMGRPVNWPLAFAVIEFAIGLGGLAVLPLVSQAAAFRWTMWWVTLVAILPPTFLMGTTFPVAARIVASSPADTGRRIGYLYGVNVFAAIWGAFAAGFLLIPLWGTQKSVSFLAAANLGLALLLLWTAPRPRHAHRGLIGIVLLGLTLGAIGLSADLQRRSLRMRFPSDEVLWHEEGLEKTVSVHRRSTGERILYVNGQHQANDSNAMVRYHRLIGHLPMLLHAEPREALIVGLGGGATAGAVSRHEGVAIDCIELSRGVALGARLFKHVNYDVLNQPGFRLRVDDGRNYLMFAGKTYDVITADVIVPRHAGAGSLYALEYYLLCRAALEPEGLMCQWTQGDLPENQYKLIMRTFLRAFPHASLWANGTLMIGSANPVRVTDEMLRRKFEPSRTRDALAEIGLREPRDLLRLYVGNQDEMRDYVGPGDVLSDDHPYIEYARSLPRDEKRPDVRFFRANKADVLR